MGGEEMVGDLLKIDRIKTLLLENSIFLEPGLSDEEIQKVETIYGIEFPEQWLVVYQQLLPISEGFYNWRDFSVENIAAIKERLASSYNGILESIDEIVWDISWGLEPARVEEKNKKIRKMLESAPSLIPLYGHRFLPILENKEMPILSVVDLDIIYYGLDLYDYFEVEFGHKRLVSDSKKYKEVPFWTSNFY